MTAPTAPWVDGDWRPPKRAMPAWLLSLVVHACSVLVLVMTVRTVSRGIGDEAPRAGTIVLADRSAEQTDYLDGSQGGAASQQAESEDQAANPVADSLPSADMEFADLDSLLPSPSETLEGGGAASGLPAAGGLTAGSAAARVGRGPEGTTSVFGAEAKGQTFVYVFDRSGSMNSHGGRPLAAAKLELINSLRDLNETQQFSVIFYNEHPHILSSGDGRPKLAFADKQGLELVEREVRGMIAFGGTQHLDPLLLALDMQPDVIFFLTDADSQQLFPSELEQVRRRNRSATIHTIEFGSGSSRGESNFLVRLANQNDGTHVYVDITKLRKVGP
ncbi:MAG: hypothetical protein WD045_06045 [Pirellulaceae bacterium]